MYRNQPKKIYNENSSQYANNCAQAYGGGS